MIRVEFVGQVVTSPQWAVYCWLAALHVRCGRPDNAELYLGQLLGMVFEREGWAQA